MKMLRGASPTCLTEINEEKYNGTVYPKYKYWGFKYKDKLAEDKKAKKVNNRINWYNTREILSEALQDSTQNHCAFCDAYPTPSIVSETIEHFRPRHKYPLLAYYWGNLFISCTNCQKVPKGWKKEDIKLVLKPDAIDYSYQKYFYFDTDTGEIKVNMCNTNEKDQVRAEKTILYYQLNNFDRPKTRLKLLINYYHSTTELNDKPFRFMFL